MAELEDKMLDSKREMQIADALDEIRTRNARIERNETRGDEAAVATAQEKIDEEALRLAKEEEEDREALRQEFRAKKLAAQKAKLEAELAAPLPQSYPFEWFKRRKLPRRRPAGPLGLKAPGTTMKPKENPSEE